MGKRKSKLGGRNSNSGSKSYKQLMCVSDGQRVNANSLLVINPRTLRCGVNVYKGKKTIHAGITGIVKIKDKKIGVVKQNHFKVFERIQINLPEVPEKEIEQDIDEAIFKAREIEKVEE